MVFDEYYFQFNFINCELTWSMDLASDFVDSDDDGTQTDNKLSKILKFPIKEQSFL